MTQQELSTEPKKGDEQQGSGNEVLRRNNRGCKSKDFYNWPEQPFDDMDSPLAVQQYIQQVIRRDPADIDEILKLPEGQDLGAWKIEHLRLFCMQLNGLASRLQECCQPETCNQMTATEQWIFLCAAHKQPFECPAIDYTRHTLDGAASLLNSNKYFPSRVTIKESSVAKLGSVCRRVYRIFSHAYYHHFQVFDEFERETNLCKRFSKFVTIYELMSKDSLIVPSDGSKPDAESTISALDKASEVSSSDDVTTVPTTDLSEDVPQQEDAATKSNNEEIVAVATQVKLESKIKKLAIEESGPSSNAAWSGSTNTMVKGSATAVSLSGDANGLASKSVDDNVSNTIPTNPATNAPARNVAPSKTGEESEA